MKKLIIALVILAGVLGTAEARRHAGYGSWDTGTGSNPQSEHVDGYQRRDGTYVAPYERTQANDTLNDNYGTRGNNNPWTGKTGNGPTDYDRNQGGSLGGNNQSGGWLGN